jgi:hypothetical protein
MVRRVVSPAVRKLAVSLGVLLCVGPSVGIADAAGRRIYVANAGCTGHSYRPRKITIACGDANFYAARLRYRAYGGPTARATGRLVENKCVPSCVAGKFASYRGSIQLSDVRTCDGRLYYERLSWTFIGTSPNPSRRGSMTIKPQACSGP